MALSFEEKDKRYFFEVYCSLKKRDLMPGTRDSSSAGYDIPNKKFEDGLLRMTSNGSVILRERVAAANGSKFHHTSKKAARAVK
jgi:hypothetical protein